MPAADPIRPVDVPPDNLVQFPKRKPPRRTTKGKKYEPDPIRVEDIALALAHCTPLAPGRRAYLSAMRLRALIVVLYRTGIRISEAVDLEERDLHAADRALLIRHGKGDKRRLVLIDEWGWDELQRWLVLRQEMPAGKVFPIVRGRNAGERWEPTDVRRCFADLQARAGIRRRFRPHQLRHGWTVENFHEGTNLLALQRQLGHAHLGVTEQYLRGIDPLTVLQPIGQRSAPRIVIPPPA